MPTPSSDAATKPRSRVWWLWRMTRSYWKHGCLRFRGVKGTWSDAMIARRMMPYDRQWTLGPIRRVER